jgi:hypothetical protein
MTSLISIGAWCIIKHYLKCMGLDGPNLPFDYAFSNLKNVIDVIEHGIDYYLERDYNDWPKYYLNGYNLHYPTNKIEINENREALKRAYNRLKDKINSTDKLVFFHFVPYNFDHDINNIEEVKNKILEQNSKCNFKIVSVKHSIDNDERYTIVHHDDQIDLINAKCVNPWKNENWCATDIEDRKTIEEIIKLYL